MKLVRGVFETAGEAQNPALEVLALSDLGETALLIALITLFLPAINLGSCTLCEIYTFISFSRFLTTV